MVDRRYFILSFRSCHCLLTKFAELLLNFRHLPLKDPFFKFYKYVMECMLEIREGKSNKFLTFVSEESLPFPLG